MPFRLRRDDARFGDLLNDLAAGLTATAGLLAVLLGEERPRQGELGPDLRAADQAAEIGANAVLRALSSAIVTPFDRVDIYRLAWAVRTAVQRMAAVGEDVVELEPDHLPGVVVELVQLLAQAAEVADDAVRHAPRPDLLTDAAVELNRLARQAREAQRRFLVEACAPGPGDADPGQLVRRAAVAQSLRGAVEAFEHLAHAIQTVAVQES